MPDFSPVSALFHTDAYKFGRIRQYEVADKVTRVYSNYTNRKSRLPGVRKAVHFGLPAFREQTKIPRILLTNDTLTSRGGPRQRSAGRGYSL
jgi:hypothetical protein